MAATFPLSPNGLKGALEADLLPTAVFAASLGVLLHLSIRNIEVDNYMYHFLTFYGIAISALGYIYLFFTDFTVVQGLTRVLLTTTSFNSGLIFSIAVYRLLFHRLRNFPGPFGAKLSRFYTVSKAAKNVQYYREVAKMHKTYGDFIRTGRNSYSIFPNSTDFSFTRAP